jgi:hypothetical protein
MRGLEQDTELQHLEWSMDFCEQSLQHNISLILDGIADVRAGNFTYPASPLAPTTIIDRRMRGFEELLIDYAEMRRSLYALATGSN